MSSLIPANTYSAKDPRCPIRQQPNPFCSISNENRSILSSSQALVHRINKGRGNAPIGESTSALSFAHEMNNPLEALISLLYLIESDPSLSKQGREYVRLANQEAERLCRITHSAMDEWRGRTPDHLTNVPGLLSSVIDLYKSRLSSRGITISTRFCAGGHLPIHSGALRRSFTNLLLNAADAMPHGGAIHVRVASTHEWAGKMRRGLRITVADNGSGIAAIDRPQILTPHFTTKGAAGNGLGLSIVRETVHQHEGVLRLRTSTTPGRSGTVFTVFIPEPEKRKHRSARS